MPSLLFSDYRDTPELSGEDKNRFEGYLLRLRTIRDSLAGKPEPWLVWEEGLRNFYYDIVKDAFAAHELTEPEGMEIYFAGSLARRQATEFSDLDSFVLFKNENDKEKCQPVFDDVNRLFHRIFDKTNQLYPDPLGINPSRLSGTPAQIVELLQNDEVGDRDAIIHAIHGARPILDRCKLGHTLKNLLSTDNELYLLSTAKHYYAKAIEEFIAPDEEMETINIKTYLLRPLDFIIAGLRQEFDLHADDGSTLNTGEVLRLLEEKHCIPQEQIDLMNGLYQSVMQTRFDLHHRSSKENDKIPKVEVEELLTQMQQLRNIIKIRKDALDEVNLYQCLKASKKVLAMQMNADDQTSQAIQLAGIHVLDSLADACREGSIHRTTALNIMNLTVALAEKPQNKERLAAFLTMTEEIRQDPLFSMTFKDTITLFAGRVCQFVGQLFGDMLLQNYGDMLINAAQKVSKIKDAALSAAQSVTLYKKELTRAKGDEDDESSEPLLGGKPS